VSDYLLIDGHNDLPWAHREYFGYDLDAADLLVAQPRLRTDIPRLLRGGVKGQFWSVFVPSTLDSVAAVAATTEQIDFVHRLISRYDVLGLALTADEVEARVAEGRLASLMGAEGGHSIGGSLDTLGEFYDRGVRYLTLTHNDNVFWADSATDVPAVGGLSDFGREVVREMNRMGMMVDLSHVAATTMRDALEVSVAPVIFSHSNARALCDVPRNVPADVLDQVAGNGGVVMATFVPMFTSRRVAAWFDEVRELASERGVAANDHRGIVAVMTERAKANPPPRCILDDVVGHVEHLREAVGVDHIGLGGDFDGAGDFPDGLEDVAAYPRLFAALRSRGWSDRDLDALAGRNVLRVMRDVEAVARVDSGLHSDGGSTTTVSESG
jgi:membrane dipeptidase